MPSDSPSLRCASFFFISISAIGAGIITPHAHARAGVMWSGLVSVYIYVYKKIAIEWTRDLIYFKFVATDFFPKIITLFLPF